MMLIDLTIHVRTFYILSSVCIGTTGVESTHNGLDGWIVDSFFHAFFWYSSTAGRFHALPLGCIGAYLATQPSFVDWLRGARIVRFLLLLSSIGLTISMLGWPIWYGDGNLLDTPASTSTRRDDGIHHMIHYVIGNVGSPLSSVLFSFLFISLVHRIGTVGSILSTIFSSKSVMLCPFSSSIGNPIDVCYYDVTQSMVPNSSIIILCLFITSIIDDQLLYLCHT
jgi:hypothetical protein